MFLVLSVDPGRNSGESSSNTDANTDKILILMYTILVVIKLLNMIINYFCKKGFILL